MDRREQIVHELLGKTVHVEVDRPIGYRHGDLIYPINYGYIPGVIAGDGDDQDAYILGVHEPISAFDGRVVGAIRRKNDREDKLVVSPDGMVFHQGEIAAAVHFQERFFDSTIDSLLRKSCGVIPYRQQGNQREYLLVLQSNNCWSFPKGHMEAGETETQTALRELAEETGLTAALDSSATVSIEYPLSPISQKQAIYFLGQVHGEPNIRQGEIQAFRWATAEKLKDYLFPDMLEACRKLIK